MSALSETHLSDTSQTEEVGHELHYWSCKGNDEPRQSGFVFIIRPKLVIAL